MKRFVAAIKYAAPRYFMWQGVYHAVVAICHSLGGNTETRGAIIVMFCFTTFVYLTLCRWLREEEINERLDRQ